MWDDFARKVKEYGRFYRVFNRSFNERSLKGKRSNREYRKEEADVLDLKSMGESA